MDRDKGSVTKAKDEAPIDLTDKESDLSGAVENPLAIVLNRSNVDFLVWLNVDPSVLAIPKHPKTHCHLASHC